MSVSSASTAAPNQAAHPLVGERDGAGRAREGNALAVTHALSAAELPRDLQHLRAEIEAYEAACLVDEGNADDVPTRRRSLIHARARVERRIRQLDDALELRGLVDRNGRLRVAWLKTMQGLILTAIRLDVTLGLERRAKTVTTLADVLAEHRERS